MKVKVKKDMMLGHFSFQKDDMIILKDHDHINELNDEYYILIYHGIRYDVHKDDVEIIE